MLIKVTYNGTSVWFGKERDALSWVRRSIEKKTGLWRHREEDRKAFDKEFASATFQRYPRPAAVAGLLLFLNQLGA